MMWLASWLSLGDTLDGKYTEPDLSRLPQAERFAIRRLRRASFRKRAAAKNEEAFHVNHHKN